ncbi:MAG: chitobiase/beta-hexosaminidase C-terminal domain-containing protein [Actinomycetota bacterium]|nr:chitobiase/beta-hexosaminidase C-terminal domain-containing protein [Actinomycetota bacterium]
MSALDASSTVNGTYCTADGTTPTLETPYLAPFEVSTEGTTTVKYYSVDRPGNVEPVKTQYVKLDKTPPTTSSNATTTPYYGSATVQLTPADSLSRVQETWYWWNNGQAQFGTTATMSFLGTYDLYWYSTDYAGNSQALQHAVIIVEPVDDNPPVTTPNFSDQTWFKTNFQVSLNAIDAVTTVTATFYSTNGTQPTTPYLAPFTVTAEGITPIKYYSVDSRGNTELTKTTGLKIDKTPPTTTSDAQASYIGTATVTISATDNWAGGPPDVSGVQRIQYKLDGDIWRDYSAPIEVSGEILHTLYYKSIDFAGNEENSQLKLISILPVDDRPPVTDSNIPGGWTKGPFYINLYAEDDVTGVAATYYYLSSEEETPTLYEGPILVAEAGIYPVRFYSVDNRGNVEPVRERVLQLDNTAPSTLMVNPQPYYVETALITLAASDSGGSGISFTKYSLNGGSWITGLSVPISTFGEHTLAFYSADGAGNVETPTVANISVLPPDTEPPVSTFNGPTGWVTAPVQVSITATDTASQIDAIFYSTNGGQTYNIYGSPWTVSAEGTTTVKYYARDTRNNTEAEKTAYVKIDYTAPVTTSDCGDTYAGDALINFFPTDAHSGVDRTYYKFDNGAWQQGTSAYINAWGWHTVYWYSVDKAGHVETTKSKLFRVRLATNTYQQDNSNIVLKGPWTTVTGSGSGGSWAHTDASGAQAHVYFNGEKMTWYGELGPNFGKANVYLDGVYKTTVDLYSAATQYDKALWDSGTITYSYHYLLIEWTGTKNASSSGTRIAADRFTIDGNIALVPDSVPPVTTCDAPVGWQSGTVLVSLASTDATTGVAATYYSTNGSYPTVPYAGAFAVSSEGTNLVKYYSVDVRGNAETVKNAYVYIDKTAPVTTSNAVPSYLDGGQTITLSPTDPLSGVASTKWRLNGGGWNTGTGVTVPTVSASHLLEWYSTDAAGNTETTKQAVFDVVKRFDQTDSNILYTGSWVTYSNANLYAGNYSYTNASSSVAHITFSGTSFDWYTYKAPECGIAQISIDNGAPVDVDLYSSGYYFQQKVFSRSALANGSHTVKISWTGRKNASASNTKIGIDTVGMIGELQQTRHIYEDAAENILYRGGWVVYSHPNHSGGSYRYTNSSGASVIFAIDGTEFSWITAKAPDFGIAQVSIDNGAPVDVDLFSGGYYFQQQVYNVTGLTRGPHTVRIDWTGRKNPSATNTKVGLDIANIRGIITPYPDTTPPVTNTNATDKYAASATIKLSASDGAGVGVSTTKWRLDGGTWTTGGTMTTSIPGSHTLSYYSTDYAGNDEAPKTAAFTVFTRYDNLDSRVVYNSSWSSFTQSSLYAGAYKYSYATSASVEVAFNGTAVDWIASRTPDSGIARVSVDGGAPTLIDIYASNYPSQQRVWSISGLAETTHTVTIAWTGTKNVSSTGTRINIDAIDLVGTLTAPLDTTPPTTTAAAKATYADSATITLTATDVNSGVAHTKWRLNSGSWQTGTTASTTATGTYSLEYYSVDKAGNVEQTRSVSFVVFARYDQQGPAITFTGGWTTYSHSSAFGGNYTYSVNAGATATITFRGTDFIWIANQAPDFGIASVSVDGSAPVLVDLYAPNWPFQQQVWSARGLTDTTHTVVIRPTGTKNASASNTKVGVDAVDLLGSLP